MRSARQTVTNLLSGIAPRRSKASVLALAVGENRLPIRHRFASGLELAARKLTVGLFNIHKSDISIWQAQTASRKRIAM